MPADPTPSLVLRLRAGDRNAGALLEERYRGAMRRFCSGYLQNPQDVEDAVQEVFCRVVAAETVPNDFRAWLYRAARNHCLNLLRSRGRRREARARASELPLADTATGPLTRLLRQEREGLVTRALAALPDCDREALLLRYAEGLSREEIARVLDLTVSVVKSRLHEGLEKLRRLVAAAASPPRGNGNDGAEDRI